MKTVQQFQDNINAYIEQLQDRWETNASFRATWGIIGAATIVVILCSSILISLNVANTVLKTSAINASSTPNSGDAQGSNGLNLNPTYPVSTAVPINTPIPGGKAVATSSLPTPTITPVPTPINTTATPTIGPTTTPDPNAPTATGVAGSPTPGGPVAATASQQPALWRPGVQNNITNLVTTPPVPNGTGTISLNYGSTCIAADITLTLDASGKATNIRVQLPPCFTSAGPSPVSGIVTINGQQVTAPLVFNAQGK